MTGNLKYKFKVGIHTAMPARPKKPLKCEYHQGGMIGLEDIITVIKFDEEHASCVFVA